MKKTIYALFLLILCIGIFPCNFASAENDEIFEKNAFRIVRKSYLTGEISLSYIFPLNSKLMEAKNFSENEIQTFRFYLASYVNALAKSNSEKTLDGVSVSGCEYYTDVDGIGFSIMFENLEAQKKFFGVTDESSQSGQNQTSSGFFIKKTEIKTTFPISSSKSAGDLKMVCLMAVSSWCNNFDLSEEKKSVLSGSYENSIFIYDFATQVSGLKSEVMYEDENFYHNVFCKSLGEIESDPSITFWVTSVNKGVWYILAIVVVITGMIVAGGVLYLKKNKKKIAKNQH